MSQINHSPISLSKPYITDQSIDAVVDVLKSGWLTQGKKVSEFEALIKDKLNIPYALAVNSATSGLHIALMALKIGPGDEVIVPSFTWVATANVVELCGATPVFVDIDLQTLNANLHEIYAKITPRTKAIIIVHLFGKAFDVEELKRTIPPHLAVIEDAACALGASTNQQLCGTMGNVGVFSFHPRKSLTTGEGGMVVTHDPHLYQTMNMLRNHGQDCTLQSNDPAYMFDCPVVGLNYRLTDIQAALGIPQFLNLEEMIKTRKNLAQLYQHYLSNCAFLHLPEETFQEQHSWQSYVVTIKDAEKRDIIMKKMGEFGIQTRPGTHAIHLLSYYKNKYQLKADDFPHSYNAFKATIALPLHNHLTSDNIQYISKTLQEIVNAL